MTTEQTKSVGFFETLYNIKDALIDEYKMEENKYMLARRKKQQQALLYLYDLYKEQREIKNDIWITPYNILMLIMLGISSFVLPKLTIILSLSYLISTELYLISDILAKKTRTTLFENLKFDNIF